MGNDCVSKQKNNEQYNGAAQKTQVGKNQVVRVDQKQVELLKLIYKDLASRSAQQEVTMQNFILFFHKNGYWGERLFKQFDTSNSTSISQLQFINGISKIFKTTQQKKIETLYKFFAQNNFQEGITFSNFLKMLYNYPKQDLKIILNDEEFINNQIKQNSRAVDTQLNKRRLESLNPFNMKSAIVDEKTFRLSQSESNSEWRENNSGYKWSKYLINSEKDQRTSWKIAIGENDVEIKTTSIHHLVKKYAKSIFKEYKINVKNGRFRYQQFRDWIIHHKKLYNVYYQGFHSEAWQVNSLNCCPLFLQQQIQFSSEAKTITEKISKNVELFLIHSILIVCEQSDKKHPINIICLEGLAVNQIFDHNSGFGVKITHRDGIYEPKLFFFVNEQVRKTWMQHLSYYKGVSVNQLYEIKQKIGKGRFSIVYNGIQKATSEHYAIKVIQTFKLENEDKNIMAHETNIMQVLSNPFLVSFKQSIASKNHIYIIAELVRGKDVFDLIHENKSLNESEAAYILEQVILGVIYIHSLGIVHRDLKPENIMVQYDPDTQILGRVKIIDFGFADYISHLQTIPKKYLWVGTPSYIAPQILKGDQFDQKIDNFAIGGILYYLLSGALPFGCKDDGTILHRTVMGQFSVEGRKWEGISEEGKDLVCRLLEVEAKERISLEQALKHGWFERNRKQLQNKRIKLERRLEGKEDERGQENI